MQFSRFSSQFPMGSLHRFPSFLLKFHRFPFRFPSRPMINKTVDYWFFGPFSPCFCGFFDGQAPCKYRWLITFSTPFFLDFLCIFCVDFSTKIQFSAWFRHVFRRIRCWEIVSFSKKIVKKKPFFWNFKKFQQFSEIWKLLELLKIKKSVSDVV